MLQPTDSTDEIRRLPSASGQQVSDRGLLVRLASSPEQIDAAQALRYRVLFQEMNGRPSVGARWRLRDFDKFDSAADHLIVLDPKRSLDAAGVVATVRLLRGRAARSFAPYLPARGFSTAADFNIEPLLTFSGEIVELGRACIDPNYRSCATARQLWLGIAAYLHAYNVGLMFGTAGFPGTQPIEHLNELAWLHHARLAPAEWRPQAHPPSFLNMDNIPAAAVDRNKAWNAMPADLKGYLRLGAMIGHGCVINSERGTLDVCIVVRTDTIPNRYHRRYQRWLRAEHRRA